VIVPDIVAPEHTRRRRRRRRSHRVARTATRVVVSVAMLSIAIAAAVIIYGSLRTNVDAVAAKGAPVYGYQVVYEYPHDPGAFTQGLIYREGYFYESTGLEGESTLRQVDVETGRVLRRHDVPRPHFAEGLTDWGFKLVQITYTSMTGFTYDIETFAERSTFSYVGQGWGLTHDDKQLIMSDGSANLRFLDPETHREVRRVEVRDQGVAVTSLNELEYVRGDIYANVWHSDRIAVIDPRSGAVREWIDLAGLNPDAGSRSEAVLNGIAYDESRDRLFVTGKWWPKLYEIRVRRSANAD
jgi:glutamine cyclotransferase